MSAALPAHFRRNGRERILVTPEGIALPLTLASRGSRFGALLLDLIMIVVLIVVTTMLLIYIGVGVSTVTGELSKNPAAQQALEFLVVLWMAAMFLFRNAWFLYFELGPRGATPGKRLTGIRIAARDGGRLTAEMVIARNLLRDIELFIPAVLLMSAQDGGDMGAAGIAATAWFLIFALFPFFNKDRLRAGDLIAGSWVVEAPKRKLEQAMSVGESARGTSAMTGAAYHFGEAELAAYGEYELQTLERVLRENRDEALVSVHEAICRKIGWNPGAGDERAFLEAYYTQLRARLEAGMRFGNRKADKFAGEATLAVSNSYRFSDTELSAYSESHLQTLERVLAENAEASLASVHQAICGKISRTATAGDERAFLEAYYAQLRAKLAPKLRAG